ncbi:MAG: L,D-transpeptidase family protein [Patescibacteria group bacterium]|nr:L,D-transpeptidase family protein [Patescibacteria group bacterium]
MQRKSKKRLHFFILAFFLACSLFAVLSALKIGTEAASFNQFVRSQLNQAPEGYGIQSVNISGLAKPVNNFSYSSQSNSLLILAPGQSENLWLELKNTGTIPWEKETFHLGTSHAQDRASVFTDSSWLSDNRIGINQDVVDPGYFVRFNFAIKAPEKSGVYYEYFQPVIDGEEWLNDAGIYWKIIVKNPGEDEAVLPVFNKIGVKKILITISQQNLKCYEGDTIVCDFTISSGLPQLPTPTGNFKVEKKRTVAYSAAYDLYMNWWMAFTPNEAYGIHELPYWKYSWGTVTEGANHLGQKVSHGCVRLGIGPAKQVYDWAPVGTAVMIVN